MEEHKVTLKELFGLRRYNIYFRSGVSVPQYGASHDTFVLIKNELKECNAELVTLTAEHVVFRYKQ